MTRGSWLQTHPYLRRVADLSAAVDQAAAGIEILEARLPDANDYRADFLAGVPLLSSADVSVDLEPGGRMAAALLERLAGSPTGPLSEESRVLLAELRRMPDASRRVANFVQGDDDGAWTFPAELRYVGWTALASFLRPVVDGFKHWRDDDRWLRRYCPTCGSPPAMAQLVGVDPGRKRLLTCGRCATQWRYVRTMCPFCESDAQKLTCIAIEGEGGLRVDYCETCKGYLKTYNGEGDEQVLLADWTSLHLDQLALDRGLQRKAASLYDIEPATIAAAACP
jgi:FdhE protein